MSKNIRAISDVELYNKYCYSDLMRGLFIPFNDQTKKQSCRFVFISWVPKEFKKSILCRSTFSKNKASVDAE